VHLKTGNFKGRIAKKILALLCKTFDEAFAIKNDVGRTVSSFGNCLENSYKGGSCSEC
jgi:hypothetical protein